MDYRVLGCLLGVLLHCCAGPVPYGGRHSVLLLPVTITNQDGPFPLWTDLEQVNRGGHAAIPNVAGPMSGLVGTFNISAERPGAHSVLAEVLIIVNITVENSSHTVSLDSADLNGAILPSGDATNTSNGFTVLTVTFLDNLPSAMVQVMQIGVTLERNGVSQVQLFEFYAILAFDLQMELTDITPASQTFLGSSLVTVEGGYFSDNSGNLSVQCLFGNETTAAWIQNPQQIQCYSPAAEEYAEHIVRISLGDVITEDSVLYTYFNITPKCYDGSCTITIPDEAKFINGDLSIGGNVSNLFTSFSILQHSPIIVENCLLIESSTCNLGVSLHGLESLDLSTGGSIELRLFEYLCRSGEFAGVKVSSLTAGVARYELLYNDSEDIGYASLLIIPEENAELSESSNDANYAVPIIIVSVGVTLVTLAGTAVVTFRVTRSYKRKVRNTKAVLQGLELTLQRESLTEAD